MSQTFEKLNTLVTLLSRQTGAHISIHDVSGLLNTEALFLDFAHRVHSKPFCDVAKSTARGYRLCMSCKMHANDRAVVHRKSFSGYCAYGLYEIARPVVVGDKTQCIIYVGNLLFNREEALRRLTKACRLTGVSDKALLPLLDEAVTVNKAKDGSDEVGADFIKLSEILDSYIRLLYPITGTRPQGEASCRHWAVSIFESYIRTHYMQDITLKNLSGLYYINEKYIGSLFKKQIGLTFHEYLNEVRLVKAVDLLLSTGMSVIQIALACGFRNVTYFNRLFLKKHGVPPVKYRNRQHARPAEEEYPAVRDK